MALVKDVLIADIDAGTYTPLKNGLKSALKLVFTDLFSHGTDDIPDATIKTQVKANAAARAEDWATQMSDKIALEVAGAVSKAVGDAVDKFVKTGVVTTPTGVPVTVVVPAGTGATTAPGIGSIS